MDRDERIEIEHAIENLGLQVSGAESLELDELGDETPVVWTLSASNASGGPGIHADLATVRALGLEAAAIPTLEVSESGSTWTSLSSFRAQWKAQSDRLAPSAVKLGPCALPTVIQFLYEKLSEMEIPLVMHPGFADDPETDDAARAQFRDYLLPYADTVVLSPRDAGILLGWDAPPTPTDVEAAAAEILERGPNAVLIHNAHQNETLTQDYWASSTQNAWFTSPQLDGARASAAAGVLSAAITAARALRFHELDAVVIARAFMEQAFGGSKTTRAQFSTKAIAWPERCGCLPRLTSSSKAGLTTPAFRALGEAPPFLLVSATTPAELKALREQGYSALLFDPASAEFEVADDEIASTIKSTLETPVRLLMRNDWQTAVNHRLFGTVLDQQELDDANLEAIAQANLCLGITAHSYTELARAQAFNPSFILLGGFFPSPVADNPYPVLGPAVFARMRKTLATPTFAFGGLNLDNKASATDAGADGVLIEANTLLNSEA